MKKLIALIIIIALPLCGCSLFGLTEESASLSDKLANVDRAEETQPESTPAPEEKPEAAQLTYEQVDPFGFIASGSLSEAQLVEQCGLIFDEERTMSYREGLESPDTNIYYAVLPENLPGTYDGSANATFRTSTKYADHSSCVYFYDYYFYDDLPADEIAAIFSMVTDAISQECPVSPTSALSIPWNDPSTIESYTEADLIDMLQQPANERSAEASMTWKMDNTSLRLNTYLTKQSDDAVQLRISYTFPADDYNSESVPEQQSESARASGSASSSSSDSPSGEGGVSFIGITSDSGDGLIELVDYGATPNGSGGYNCYITLANRAPDMTKIAIEVWLYGGYEEADIITIAQPAAFHSGDSHTFDFEISTPPDSGVWEVLVNYWYW
ncbi:MAG: hypothetical protein ACOYJB_06315 [Christensenellaceae bacterium]